MKSKCKWDIMVPTKKYFRLFKYVDYLLNNKQVNKWVSRWELENISH